MLKEEAIWLADWIYRMPVKDVFPLCNIGSSTLEYRAKKQPFIDELIFKPARDKGLPVIHVDLKSARGVDIVGDISNPELIRKLSQYNFKSILCANILEHVKSPGELCSSLTSIIPNGSYLMVTVPYKYPYHPDPIDNMFRPTPLELADLFINTKTVKGEIVIGRSFIDELREEPIRIRKWLARLAMPYYHPMSWLGNLATINYLFSNYKVSCLISQKLR